MSLVSPIKRLSYLDVQTILFQSELFYHKVFAAPIMRMYNCIMKRKIKINFMFNQKYMCYKFKLNIISSTYADFNFNQYFGKTPDSKQSWQIFTALGFLLVFTMVFTIFEKTWFHHI